MENSFSSKICKTSRKYTYCGVQFHESCRSKIWRCNKHETCFLKLLKRLTAWSQRKLKNKILWSMFVRLWLKFWRNLGGKSNIRHLIDENFIGEKWNFSWNFVNFSREEFSSTKIILIKIFPDETLTCRTHCSKWKLKLNSIHTFRYDIPIVNMIGN